MGRLTNFVDWNGLNLVRAVFIETGTFGGESLAAAARASFETLHSIDIVPAYVEAAQRRFADDPRVHVWCGSSPDLLPQLMDPTRATTFWLDAHYQRNVEQERDPRYGECPLLRELRLITALPWVDPPLVLIDDADVFHWLPTGFRPGDWPRVHDIRAVVPADWTMTERANVFLITRNK